MAETFDDEAWTSRPANGRIVLGAAIDIVVPVVGIR